MRCISFRFSLTLCATLSVITLSSLSADLFAQETDTPAPAAKKRPDPYKDLYKGYQPAFMDAIIGRGAYRDWQRDEETMKLSYEKKFYTLNILEEDTRANALVEAGLKKEEEGQFREALKIYQEIIDRFPNSLYRVSEYGVFVPVSQYCQRRILGFPANELEFYRTLFDARAKETFLQAKKNYSLLGLSDVVRNMLATSYGGPAILELGNASLDAGHYLAALEYFTTVRDVFPDKSLHTEELNLKIAYCRKMLGESQDKVQIDSSTKDNQLTPEQLKQFEQVVANDKYEKPPFHSQITSETHTAADDYTLQPPSEDPLGLKKPVWKFDLPGTRNDFYVYSQPVVTGNSVIYRHKNIVYCRSILNGELRWKNDMGGRATWQNFRERQYSQEDVLVQDGLVFTTINKAGPSLVALDEVTGQLRWAYGPMVATTEEEARMRFEIAPTGGQRTVYAGYVLDNIQGETHTDSEYGVIAFESTTGRIHWRKALCRLAPGKFSGGFAERRRNRIRSFLSPPLYHQGTVYYNTNAGAIAALDSLSGRVKWLTRYPYHPGVHDATRQFGRGGGLVQHSRVYFTTHTPMFWYNQRPLIVGERLFIGPVDTPLLHCLDRRTGQVEWAYKKPSRACAYILGMTKDHQLAIACSGRKKRIAHSAYDSPGPLHLLDPSTGETQWEASDVIKSDPSPSMTHYVFGSNTLHWQIDKRWFEMNARPQMTSDNKVYLPSFCYVGYPIFGYISSLGVLDLEQKKVVGQRRYYSGEILARASTDKFVNGPEELKGFEDLPVKDQQTKQRIEWLKESIADKLPENEYDNFLPFSRITFERYGQPFEVRMDARSIEMVYDINNVHQVVDKQNDPAAKFARAELAVADSRLNEASSLLKDCLNTISSEDLDFRAAINQQLFRVHQRLARSAIRAGRSNEELENCLGMSRTVGTLAEEIETLFAVADAFERQGKLDSAAKALQTIISTYGHHEFPVNPIVVSNQEKIVKQANSVIEDYQKLGESTLYGNELARSMDLMRKGLPLYFSTVSPLSKSLTVRAGELASLRLLGMQKNSSTFQDKLQKTATENLTNISGEELLSRLYEYPGTEAAQKALDTLAAEAAKTTGPEARQKMWELADAARVSGLILPEEYRPQVLAPELPEIDESLDAAQKERTFEFKEAGEAARILLKREGDRSISPNVYFVGSRLKKRLDNKFVLAARDSNTGKELWNTGELRLKGKGQEPGFFTAFVHKDLVVVHGLFDVLAFNLDDGKLRWRYRVPFDFEIRSSILSGDLLLLSGSTETIALYIETEATVGEVAWQVQELGDLYSAPYMSGDRMVSVRKLPYSVTVRYRATGRMIGRLDLPDLTMFEKHPLIEQGPEELPIAHYENLLLVSDGWYYILIDTTNLSVIWKRLVDNNNVAAEPAMRFAMNKDYIAVLKEDYDQKAIYMLSAKTGEILWNTDPKDSQSPQPMHSMLIVGDTIYGLGVHPGQGYFLVARDCPSGKAKYSTEISHYKAKPGSKLLPQLFGKYLVVRTAVRQDFELRAFDGETGKDIYHITKPGVGPFGEPGRMSATVQNGRLLLMSKEKLSD